MKIFGSNDWILGPVYRKRGRGMSCGVKSTFCRFYFHMRTGQSVWEKPSTALASEGAAAENPLDSHANATVELHDRLGHCARDYSAQGRRVLESIDYDECRMADSGEHSGDCKTADEKDYRKVCEECDCG